MWRSILRKIMRDVSARKTRTFLVAASIFVGVLGVVGLFTTSFVIAETLENDISADEIAMIELRVSLTSDDTDPNNAEYLEILNQENEVGQAQDALAGIEQVEAWAYYFVSSRTADMDTYEDVELRARFTPLEESVIEPIQLREGRFPVAGQNEIALEIRMAERLAVDIGDSLFFRTNTEEGVSEVEYTIIGLVFDPYSTRGVARDQPTPDIGVYAQYPDVQDISGAIGVNRFLARYDTFEQAEANFAGFVNLISSLTPYSPVQPKIENPIENRQVEAAEIFTNVLNSLAILTMIVSGFLVVNVINTIIAEQKTQIGVLKSIGVTVSENFYIYCGIAFVYGVIGTITGIIPGILLSQYMTNLLAPELDIIVNGFQWAPEAVILGIIMGLLVPVLAAMVPVYNGSRISIIDAITDLGISSDYGSGFFPNLIKQLPVPISARQAVSNVYQKRWRLVLTGITLTVTIATFMSTTSLTVSITNEIRGIFDRLGYQIVVQPTSLQDYEAVAEILDTIDGIERIEFATIAFIQVEGNYRNFFTGDNQLQIFGIDPEGDSLTFQYVEGDGWTNDPEREGIVVSQAVANQIGKTVGDTMDIVVAGQPYEIEIIGIDAGGFDASNMRWQQLSELAGYVAGAPVPNEYLEFGSAEGEIAVAIGTDDTQLTFIASDYDPANPGVVITAELAETIDADIGETIEIMVGDQTVDRTVLTTLGKADLVALDSRFESAPDGIIMFGFSDLTSITGVDTSGEIIPNGYYVTMDNPDPSPEEVDTFIGELETALLAEGITAQYINQEEQEQTAIDGVGANTAIFLVMSVLIAVVGAIGLLTTLTISVFERQKEIGVMRSIGAGSSVIAFQFMLEGIIVGMIAWAVGLPLGYFQALGLNAVAQLDNVPFTYPVSIMALGLVGMLVIASLASIIPSISAARKTVSDILRYQ